MTFLREGYVDDSGGFTGGFSWHRHVHNRNIWWVIGCQQFQRSGDAVVDDFGNLVEVV